MMPHVFCPCSYSEFTFQCGTADFDTIIQNIIHNSYITIPNDHKQYRYDEDIRADYTRDEYDWIIFNPSWLVHYSAMMVTVQGYSHDIITTRTNLAISTFTLHDNPTTFYLHQYLTKYAMLSSNPGFVL